MTITNQVKKFEGCYPTHFKLITNVRPKGSFNPIKIMLAKKMTIIHHWKQTNLKGHTKKLETTMEDHQLIIYDECI